MIAYRISYEGRKANKHVSAPKVLIPDILINSMVDKVAHHPWDPYGRPQDLRVTISDNRDLEDVIKSRIFRGNVILIYLQMLL